MKKALYTAVYCLIILTEIFSQVPQNKLKKIEIESSQTDFPSYLNYKNPPFHDFADDPSGAVPGLMTYWDYVTNGNNLKRIWVMGDTVIIVADWVDSLNAANTSARRTKYQVSYNGGLTWLPAPIQITTVGSCYPDASIINYQGKKTVVITGREYVPGLIGYACLDSSIGTGHLRVNAVPYVGRDYYTSKLSDSLIAGCYSSTDTLWFLQYNYLRNAFGIRQLLAISPDFIPNLSRFFVAASSNTQNIFAMWWYNSADSAKMFAKESINGGVSFGSRFTVVPNKTVIHGDTIYPFLSGDIIYKPGTNIKCASMSTNWDRRYNHAQSTKIIFWSPNINGGLPVNIADWTNIPILHDTLAFNSNLVDVQNGMTNVSHPSLAYSDDGSVLFCVFSVVQDDTTWYSFRYNDIWCSFSTNNGETWAAPFNLTNTHNEDEIYPSISKSGNNIQGNTATIHVTYMQSNFPGSASFVNTYTPVSRNYHIYKKFQFTITKINSESGKIPKSYSLHQNYPNPFNPVTKIKFDLPQKSFITIKIFNAVGEEITKLVNDNLSVGSYEVNWDGTDFASGVYFYRLESDDYSVTKRMVLLK